jgi:hypothetical protein
MMRSWLTTLIREAVRAEVEQHLRTLEDKTARIESNFASIAIRVKEKQEQQKKQPTLGHQWGSVSKRLEENSESNG